MLWEDLKVFQKIRNIVAHSSYVTTAEVAKLLENSQIKTAMSDYPKNLEALYIMTQVSLVKLRETRAFHNQNAKKRISDLYFEKDRSWEILDNAFGDIFS